MISRERKKRIAIFASGGGSNAKCILEYFENRSDIDVSLIVSNKSKAGVLNHARDFGVSRLVMDRSFFFDTTHILYVLEQEEIDLIVLAGFLWLIPPYLIQAFPNKIINIHPSLLPKYGGKGMYGQHVHHAVKENSEQESGMTIHYVNEVFDEGEHIFQAKVDLEKTDSADEIAKKVLQLEHQHYAQVIDEILKV